MDTDLENIIETHSTELLQHLAVCIVTGRRLTQGETKNLLRFHLRRAVRATERILAARRSQSDTEKERAP